MPAPLRERALFPEAASGVCTFCPHSPASRREQGPHRATAESVDRVSSHNGACPLWQGFSASGGTSKGGCSELNLEGQRNALTEPWVEDAQDRGGT